MTSSDLPPNDKDDEQVSVGVQPVNSMETGSKSSNSSSMGPKMEMINGQTVKSTPPSSGNNTETANKRKRESLTANMDANKEETETSKDTPEEKHVKTIETATLKEVEMKDAELIDGSINRQDTKEVEMQDAEVVYNETDVKEKSIKEGKRHPEFDNDDRGSNLDASEGSEKDPGIKESEQPTKVEASESNIEKQSMNGSGKHALGEVATLLKQVQESDEKARLEVEVKVKKIDQGN